jgi:mRNA-degrading endonuclease toxin of MazEF toxin-antitoxin module
VDYTTSQGARTLQVGIEQPIPLEIEPRKTNGLRQPCAENLSSLRTISQSRLVTRVGRLEDAFLPRVEHATIISPKLR